MNRVDRRVYCCSTAAARRSPRTTNELISGSTWSRDRIAVLAFRPSRSIQTRIDRPESSQNRQSHGFSDLRMSPSEHSDNSELDSTGETCMHLKHNGFGSTAKRVYSRSKSRLVQDSSPICNLGARRRAKARRRIQGESWPNVP